MNENEGKDTSRDEFLFQHLVAMFQTLAYQQLGKLINPITGEVEGDLQQAKITIDMLAMLKKKTEGNLEEGEKKLIDNVVMELQMNYIESLKDQVDDADEEDAGEEEEVMKKEGDEAETGEREDTEPEDSEKS